MRFEMLIESLADNDCMRSRVDVAFALEAVARKLRNNSDAHEGQVRDLASTHVGFWTIAGDEASGVFDVSEQVDSALRKLARDPGNRG